MADVTVQSLLNTAVYDSYTGITLGTKTVAQLKADIQTATGVSVDWFDLVYNETVLVEGNTLTAEGVPDGAALRTHNKIARLADRETRQVAKLALASLDRAPSGRSYVSDIDTLPTKYSGDAVVDNPNPDGLLLGRPWLGSTEVTVVVENPSTPEEAVSSSTWQQLVIWYDGSNSAYFTPDGTDESSITQWSDRSAQAHNANTTGASKPTYEDTVPLNSYGYVEFNGGQYFDINPFTQLVSATNFTAFVLAKRGDTANTETLTSTNQNDLKLRFNGTTTEVSAAGLTGTVSGVTTTGWTTHMVQWNASGATDADKLSYRYNKTAWSSPTYTGTAAATMSASNTRFSLGAFFDGSASEHFTGYVAEVLLFAAPLNLAEQQSVENYLYLKWGL